MSTSVMGTSQIHLPPIDSTQQKPILSPHGSPSPNKVSPLELPPPDPNLQSPSIGSKKSGSTPLAFVRMHTSSPFSEHFAGLKSKFAKLANLALIGGAVLSFADIMSDIYIAGWFVDTGQTSSGIATISSLTISLILQCFITGICHHKRDFSEILFELFYVVLCIKPGIDVYRVVSEAEQHELSLFTTSQEMLYVRCVELIFESLPGTMIQTVAFMEAKAESTQLTVLSLVVSIMTAAYISASISIEKDIEREGRNNSSYFYGFVPLESIPRTVLVSLLTFVMAAMQLSLKCFSCALCAVVSGPLLLAFLFVEMCAFFLYKIARHDLYYWIPINGLLGALMTFIIRFSTKLMVDFTACLHMRHHCELGGAAWAATLAFQPITCAVFGVLYLNYVDDEENTKDMVRVYSKTEVLASIGGLAALQVIAFGGFMLAIDGKYIHTFFSTLSGAQDAHNLFKQPKPEDKLRVFKNNRMLWIRIAPEVRTWLNSNIEEWNETEPAWWTEKMKAIVPDDFVDDPDVLAKIREKRRLSRRSTGWWKASERNTSECSNSDKMTDGAEENV